MTKKGEKKTSKFEDYDMDGELNALITYRECMQSGDKNKWKEAINNELDLNDTWAIVDESRSKGKEIVTDQWVLKIKENGKYKARLPSKIRKS